jgi:tRNA ligase
MPNHQDMSDAIDLALNNTVTIKHDLSFKPSNRQARGQRQIHGAGGVKMSPGPQQLTPEELTKRLEYFGVTVSATVINSMLSNLFAKAPADEARVYNILKQSRRLQQEFHVTLIHRVSLREKHEIWEKYVNDCLQAMVTAGANGNKQPNPSLGPARVRLERLVWDERIMGIVVRIMPFDQHHTGTRGDWPCAYPIPHITIGTRSPDVKPKETTDLLVRWMDGNDEGRGPKIWEMEIPGMKVLEGTVRAVMRRGR